MLKGWRYQERAPVKVMAKRTVERGLLEEYSLTRVISSRAFEVRHHPRPQNYVIISVQLLSGKAGGREPQSMKATG